MVNPEDVGIGESLNDYAKSLGGGQKTKKIKKSKKKSQKGKSKSKDPRLSALGEGTKFLYG